MLKLNRMLRFGKRAAVTTGVLAMSLLAAATAFGAEWDSVMQITEGQKIELKMRDGAQLKGTFISATAESVAIRYKSGEQSVDRVNVLRVRVYDAGRRTSRGLLWAAIGAGAGAGFGFMVCPSCPNEGAGAKYVRPAAAIGAAGGGTLGFLSSSYKTIYKVK
jgi:hypothetical protein